MLAAQLNELGVSQGPEAPPRPNRQHKGPPTTSTSNSVQPASANEQNNKQMQQSSSILDQVSVKIACAAMTMLLYIVKYFPRFVLLFLHFSRPPLPHPHIFLLLYPPTSSSRESILQRFVPCVTKRKEKKKNERKEVKGRKSRRRKKPTTCSNKFLARGR